MTTAPPHRHPRRQRPPHRRPHPPDPLGLVLVLGVLIVSASLGLGLSSQPRSSPPSGTPPSCGWPTCSAASSALKRRWPPNARMGAAPAGLLLAPIDRSVIYAGKLVSNLILMFGVAAVITAVGLLFFGFDFSLAAAPLGFILIIAISMFGFAAVGTLFSARSVSSTASRAACSPWSSFRWSSRL